MTIPEKVLSARLYMLLARQMQEVLRLASCGLALTVPYEEVKGATFVILHDFLQFWRVNPI